MRKKFLASILAATMVLLAGCGGSGGSADSSAGLPDEIHIALVAPMTGDNAQYGQQFQRGIDIFVEEYNAKGGYKGTPIKVTTFDDKNDAKEAVNIANMILSDGNYFSVIGPFSSTCAFAMGEVLDEEKVLTISPSVSHPDYVNDFEYTFRLAHINSSEGVFAAKYIAQKMEGKKVAGIYTNNDWGLTVGESFATTVTSEGMEVMVNEAFIQGQTKDFSPIITKIKQSGADTLYLMCNYTEAGQILRQVKDMDLDINVLVSTIAYKAETLEIAGDAAEGAIFITSLSVDDPDPRIQEFRAVVREKYDVEIDNMIVRAYDSPMILMMALENGGEMDPDTMRREIINLKDVSGVSGAFTILENRNVSRPFSTSVADGNGSFKYMETPEVD